MERGVAKCNGKARLRPFPVWREGLKGSREASRTTQMHLASDTPRAISAALCPGPWPPV